MSSHTKWKIFRAVCLKFEGDILLRTFRDASHVKDTKIIYRNSNLICAVALVPFSVYSQTHRHWKWARTYTYTLQIVDGSAIYTIWGASTFFWATFDWNWLCKGEWKTFRNKNRTTNPIWQIIDLFNQVYFDWADSCFPSSISAYHRNGKQDMSLAFSFIKWRKKTFLRLEKRAFSSFLSQRRTSLINKIAMEIIETM